MTTKVVPPFDEKGLLPPGCYECRIDELKEKFVDDFPESDSRVSRFNGFVAYSKYFCQQVKSTRKQLINGSFTTNKVNPNDVDVVIVINYCELTNEEVLFLEIEQKEEEARKDEYQVMKKEVELGLRDINELYCCDCYCMYKREPNEGKEVYEDYLKDKEYWVNCWGNSRRDKITGKKYPKGIITLKMNLDTFEGI